MILDRNTFESAYAGQSPWYIGRPNKVLVDVADRITGSVLDTGCGTGENALFFAGRAARSRALTSSRRQSTGPSAR